MDQTFYDTWEKACGVAKIGDRHLHDFRRTAVRNFDRKGIPARVAMQLSGHQTFSIYQRYNIVSESDINDAAAKLEGKNSYKIVTRNARIKK
jgi:integrase